MNDTIEELLDKLLHEVKNVSDIYSKQCKRRNNKEGSCYATGSEVLAMEKSLAEIDSCVNIIESKLEIDGDISKYQKHPGYDRYINIDVFRVVFWRELAMDYKYLLND